MDLIQMSDSTGDEGAGEFSGTSEKIRASTNALGISAATFAKAMSNAFSDATTGGKQFDDVLKQLALRLSNMAVASAFPMSPRAILDPLALTFAFDASEQDGVLKFRQRGGSPVVSLEEDDLLLPNDGAPARLTRAQETDLPREVTIAFTNIETDYQRGAATSRRLIGGSARSAHADLAVVTSEPEAERRAQIWLQDIWASRETADFALAPSRLALEPGDVMDVTVNGRRRLMQIQEIADAESRLVKARSIDPEVFNLALPPPRRRVPAIPAAVGPVHALVLELPSSGTGQSPPLMRLAVFADPWPGPVAVWASADGLSFRRVGLAMAPAIVGQTVDVLPSGPTGRWHQASFRVQLYGGALASVSDLALFAGANAAAIQRTDGAWEVIQFAHAELAADRTYLLSRLLRGQGGSEWAMAPSLPAGAPFALLDQHVFDVVSGLDALERNVQLRVVPAGLDHGDSTALALAATPHATALRPLAPVHLKAVRGANGIAISWVRRTRLDGDTWAGEVPLGEDNEQYAVDIFSGAEIVRTITSAAPSALYPASQEQSDFGAPQSSLRIRVTQLSATVGRGFAAEKLFNL